MFFNKKTVSINRGDIIKEGFLEKESRYRKIWRKRWCVLTNQMLYTFEQQGSYINPTEEIETGFTLDVLPRILEHGRMLVMFNMTLSDLLTLEKVSFGDEQENQYIQNPKVESRAFTQEVAMTSGESLILTGYEKVSSETEKTGTGSAENSLLGGTAGATRERNVLVIIMTPVVLETPLSPETRMTMN